MIPKALLFNVFAPVIDWRSVIARDLKVHFQIYAEHEPAIVADAWRIQNESSNEPIPNGSRDQVNPVVFDLVIMRSVADGLEFDLGLEEHPRRLSKTWYSLPYKSDSAAGVSRLNNRFVCTSQSNGHPALDVNLVTYDWFSWDIILGSEIVRGYKPAPKAYTGVCETLGLQPPDCMTVAAHDSDLTAARAEGLQTDFVRRPTEHSTAQSTVLEASDSRKIMAKSISGLTEALDDLR